MSSQQIYLFGITTSHLVTPLPRRSESLRTVYGFNRFIAGRNAPAGTLWLREDSGLALLVASAFFMEFLDGTVIATALPDMAKAFGVTAIDLNIGISAYLLTLAVLIRPTAGLRSVLAHETSLLWHCAFLRFHPCYAV
ncbi:major facilitator superfamily permease [Klebsiella michiganensis]|uniref:Major facilitator superfamily permease n=1 Tax=Klebsiella michiganensis TaxID=1134687 RepID=A0A7H4MWV2_9ENTR|nr:major facilitator superfamily permease [Klebsiella michiganensis]